jgi:PAS domain S-box-containing protein
MLDYFEEGSAFGAGEMDILRQFAQLASVALENARLYAAAQAEVAERRQAELALRESQARLEGIINTALNAIITVNEEQRIVLFNPYAETIFACKSEFALGKPLDIFIPARYRDLHRDKVTQFGATNTSNRTLGQSENLYGLRADGEEFPLEAYVSQQVIGDKKFFTVILRDITERKRAEEDLRRRAHELEALATASAALRTAQNVTDMVPVLAKQALRAVGGNYSSIFLLDPASGDYVSHGWFSARGESINKLKDESILRHRPGEGITGHVAVTGEIYVTEDMQKDTFMLMLEGERKRLQNLHGGISLPLRAQEKIIGVLHIWMVEPHIFNETEIRILIALAEIASNAIHRAMLFEQTLQHADELAHAYDNTLAGWARALELRDEITEGHTRRVTELTLKLASAMGIPDHEMTDIQRGALLHDIGKMGIPDAILQKPGAFTVRERRIMQQHPQYARDMLAGIPFLQAALDIPYCHHEHWDGSGYPRGLKGMEIPLAARIFSIIDVWDALTSDRPYRSAWSEKKTLKYIRDGSGKQFDPRVVEAFLRLIEK